MACWHVSYSRTTSLKQTVAVLLLCFACPSTSSAPSTCCSPKTQMVIACLVLQWQPLAGLDLAALKAQADQTTAAGLPTVIEAVAC